MSRLWNPSMATRDVVLPLTVGPPTEWRIMLPLDWLTASTFVAELFGVMAVAGAMGRFHRPQDGIAGGAIIGGSGPHSFIVTAGDPALLADLLLLREFRKLVGVQAYRWSVERRACPAEDLSGGIWPDSIYWPLPNVVIAGADARLLAAGWKGAR